MEECPFCEKGLVGREVLHETVHWRVLRNIAPYFGAKDHLLFITPEHVVDLKNLAPEAWVEVPAVVAWAEERYGKAGSLVLRLGTFAETGSTIPHFHWHWITRQDGPDAPTVYPHFGPKRFAA